MRYGAIRLGLLMISPVRQSALGPSSTSRKATHRSHPAISLWRRAYHTFCTYFPSPHFLFGKKSWVLQHIPECLLARVFRGAIDTFQKALLTRKYECSEHSETWYRDQILDNYSHGVAHTSAEVEDNEKDHRKWMNPLETRLPLAPNLKIFCFYGVGKSTERSYFYREDQDPNSSLNVTMDTSLSMGVVDHGVIPGEGDGTVPLLSNGCKALLELTTSRSRLVSKLRDMLQEQNARFTPHTSLIAQILI